jgi:hypothetical protein
MKNLSVLVVFVVLLTVIFSGCKIIATVPEGEAKAGTISSIHYDNSTKINVLPIIKDLIGSEVTYPYDLLGTFSYTMTIDDIRNQISSFCIRYNKGSYYGVARTKNKDGLNGYLFMLFNDELKLEDGMLIYKLTNKNDYSSLKNNVSTSVDVKKIDPGTFLFGNLEVKGAFIQSFHRLLDGTLLTITYKENLGKFVVTDTFYKKDPTGFASLLLPDDLDLIK